MDTMTDSPAPDAASALAVEDAKLVALARSARARVDVATAAAVRDDTGRSYVGADVSLPSLRISGLELAVAQAVAAGASGLEAAVIVSVAPTGAETAAVVGEVGPTGIPVHVTDARGTVVRTFPA